MTNLLLPGLFPQTGQQVVLFFQCNIEDVLVSAIYRFRILEWRVSAVVGGSGNSQNRTAGFDLQQLRIQQVLHLK